ncbi:MAG TPA: helix-turn-helix domain-containing protein [Candidatus Polarisedimenticolia bacterium]|nr:helix-turn-helix domain-containing protein [Candidatus Polarisedimenticolia bacterium]
MRYTVMRPAPALAPHLECLWRLAGDGRDLPPETIVPDGCMEVVLHCGDRFARLDAGGAALQARAFLVGQMLAPIVVRPGTRVETWGIRFRPGGAAAFFDAPMPELTGRFVDLADVVGAGGLAGLEPFHAARPADRARCLEAWLVARLGGRAADPLPALAARAIVRARGRVRIDDLSSRLGLGARQLERRFLRGVGIPPRALARLVRFQQVFRLVHARPATAGAWADVACDAGYYDQAHLLRDFRELAGTTPPRFLAQQGEFSRALTGRERLDDLFA